MAFSNQNQTNPSIIRSTGYEPYIKARAERAGQKSGKQSLADRRAQSIRSYWVQQDALQEIGEYARSHEKDLFRNQWECSADKKSLLSRVRWEMDKVTTQMDDDLERRRSCLAALLKSEEESYLQEAVGDPESEGQRTERMLRRYKELKTKKEEERMKIVEEKKEQQFRRNCDELRSLTSRQLHHETAADGRQMMLEKRASAEEKDREERMFDRLWVEDSRAKEDRDRTEAEERRRKDEECSRDVVEQMRDRKWEKLRKLRNRDEDAEILAEKKRLDELESEWELQMKSKKKESAKRDLDECVKEKLKRKTKEVQDDLMQDLFFLKQIMDDNDQCKQNEKKRALLREQQLYLQHLRDRMQKEAEFEKDLDRMYQDELDKVWDKRQKEWQDEKEKRRQLEQDVMKAVRDQVEHNTEKGRQAHSMNQEYARKVLEEDERDRKALREKLKLIRERNAQHQKELLEQIKMKEAKLEEEKRLRDKELEAVRKARENEEEKVQRLLSEMRIDNEHPYRICRRELFNECDGC